LAYVERNLQYLRDEIDDNDKNSMSKYLPLDGAGNRDFPYISEH